MYVDYSRLTQFFRYKWLDQSEGLKVRHQIKDLLALMAASKMPSVMTTFSIGHLVMVEQMIDSSLSIVDFFVQITLAREVILRLTKSNQSWHGGITTKFVYDMIASELVSKHINPEKLDPSNLTFIAHENIKRQQVEGLVNLVEEMQWPYRSEIKETCQRILNPDASKPTQVGLRGFDWINGIVLPGSIFPISVLGTLYELSPTLQVHMPNISVDGRQANYGIVYSDVSYWNHRSMIGKILAPFSAISEDEVRCIGGWVGPCPSPSLPQSNFGIVVELVSQPPPWVLPASRESPSAINQTATDLELSDLGLPTPPVPVSTGERIALPSLRLSKVEEDEPKHSSEIQADNPGSAYRAQLDFQLAQDEPPVTTTLRVNSIFISAIPCHGGPHSIDPKTQATYAFRTVGVRDLPSLQISGGFTDVTVINASGHPTWEVFARAWCCERGVNAIIWKSKDGPCFKCALMMATTEGLATKVLISC